MGEVGISGEQGIPGPPVMYLFLLWFDFRDCIL